VRELKARGAKPGVVYSINVPKASEAETRGVAVARMGGMEFTLAFTDSLEAGRHEYRPKIAMATEGPAGTDTEAFLHDMITITPLLFDWTAYPVLDELKAWHLTPKIGGN